VKIIAKKCLSIGYVALAWRAPATWQLC